MSDKEWKVKNKVNILGTTYKIKVENKKDLEGSGNCDHNRKEITVIFENSIYLFKRTLRHEIIHAYQYESGLAQNFEHKPIGYDETQVDWFAIQSPKIFKTFKELDIL